MINFLKTTVLYTGLGTVSLGAIIVYASIRGNFNAYIFGTGVLLVIVPIVVYFILVRAKDKSGLKPRLLSDLKLTGIKIPVDLTKCVVKSNSWSAQVENNNSTKVAFF